MQKQIEITNPTKLLDENGLLTQPGWCRRNIFEYNRDAITAPHWRIKEWDFYQVANDHYMVQICFANISIGCAGTASLLDLKTGRNISAMGLTIGTMKRFIPPENGDRPYHFIYEQGKNRLEFEVTDRIRNIKFDGVSKGKRFSINLTMDMLENHESITIATPFKLKGRFFYTQKINCMPTEGTVTYGDEIVTFSKENTYCVLDWGRGVWPHKNAWFWGNGSTKINDKLFGFELTWGFGDESNATETCVFYDGKAHKIGAVNVEVSPKGRWMEPWHFISDDGRFDLTMKPFYDNVSGLKVLGLVGAKCHQVHGYWDGFAILDDGTKIEVKNMYAFCEYMENLW